MPLHQDLVRLITIITNQSISSCSDKEMEHLDWNARTRIIMGTAYCLQYMHELNPPISHTKLVSSAIYLTDDYAAKVLTFLLNKKTVLVVISFLLNKKLVFLILNTRPSGKIMLRFAGRRGSFQRTNRE